ncbi:Glucose-6-phosphate isomerase [Verticillium dahliae VDG2]|nr:Glucose-6-phosphate isomerase [Verticillium dahliae VDG2]
MSRARRRLAFVASLILLVSPSLAQTPENDFSLYPSSARPCLLDASDRSKCKGDDVPSNNRCLCSNGGDFVTNAATCIGTDAPDTLLTVYTTMRTACSDSGTEVSISQAEFMALGARASSMAATATTTRSSPSATGSTTTTTTTTAVSSESSTPSDVPVDTGLSTGAKAGIGIGSAVGAAVFIGFAAMAPGYPPSSWASPPQAQAQAHQAWGQHPDQAWTGGHLSPPLPMSGPQGAVPAGHGYGQDPGVYELASVAVDAAPVPNQPSAVYHAVEMPGSPVPEQYNSHGSWRP